MYELVYIVKTVILLFVEFLSSSMLVRAILSWFPLDEDNKLVAFFYYVTEPIIMPMRMLFDCFGWGRMSPIDLPFLVTVVELSLLYFIISMI